MEMSAEFFGSEDGAFFDFDSISKNRRIKYPMLPDRIAQKVKDSKCLMIPTKQSGEIRILSADIALMRSKKHNNDATAIFINQMTQTKAKRYVSNIVYGEVCEGLRTDDQALMIRKLFDEYQCDYIVLDTQGVGLGVFDALARDIIDSETGEIYPALSCCNDAEMAARCPVTGAEKVIWSIKANAQFNSDAAFLLREGFRSGRIRLLETEYDAEETLGSLKGFKNLNPQEKVKFQLPYINTTLLIDELTKLNHQEVGGKVKLYERSGMRKDRYSSLSYNYYVAIQLGNKLNKRQSIYEQSSNMFIIKPPSFNNNLGNGIGGSYRSNKGRVVNNRIEKRNSRPEWV